MREPDYHQAPRSFSGRVRNVYMLDVTTAELNDLVTAMTYWMGAGWTVPEPTTYARRHELVTYLKRAREGKWTGPEEGK